MTKSTVYSSDFLFTRPSFIRGMARALDLGTTQNIYNESVDADTADSKAISSDWILVGADMYDAMEKYHNAVK